MTQWTEHDPMHVRYTLSPVAFFLGAVIIVGFAWLMILASNHSLRADCQKIVAAELQPSPQCSSVLEDVAR